MAADMPFVVSLSEAAIAGLKAIEAANRRAGRGPTSRSAIIRCAVEKMLADSKSFAPGTKPRR